MLKISVAKSTLSLWLRNVGLAKRHVFSISEKKRLGALRGAESRNRERISLVHQILTEAEREIGVLSSRELWFVGIALYWAEGSKEKEYAVGSGVKFSNSDPKMIKLFIKWLVSICGVKRNLFIFEIYIHENSKNNIEKVKDFWACATSFPVDCFDRVYFKKHTIKKMYRKNTQDLYYGQLRVKVRASSILNRKIAGWVNGISKG